MESNMTRLIVFVLALISTQSMASDFGPRIIGGGPADSGEWPTMVQLFKGEIDGSDATYFCGGTLISDRWVLTAAHCFYDARGNVDTTPSDMFIVAKSLSQLGQGDRVGVSQIVIHESYQVANEYDSDIALLELTGNVTNPSLQNIYFGVPVANCMASIVGWGATSPTTSDQASSVLKDAEVPIISQADCEKTMGNDITGNMLCAGFTAGGTDTCPGDSGGPIFLQQSGEFRQVGITSWGPSACGAANTYGVYTRLSSYTNWIMGKTGFSTMVPLSGEACTPSDNPNPAPEPDSTSDSGGGGSWGWGGMVLALLLFRRKA